MRSQSHSLDLTPFVKHYGDSLLPYLPANHDGSARERTNKRIGTLPIIIKGKMKYVKIRPLINSRTLWDRQKAFPDSTLRGPRREIRCACKIQLDLTDTRVYVMSFFFFPLFYHIVNVIVDSHSPVVARFHLTT